MSTEYDRRPSPLVQLIGFMLPAFILALLLAMVLWWAWPRGSSGIDPLAQPRTVEARGDLSSEEKMNIEIYQSASPAVVFVTSLADQHSLFSLNVQRVPRGAGSGFVWDDQGHIVTNYHVVKGATGANVTLADHSTRPAQEIWYHPDMDIAVISIDPGQTTLRPLPIGTSHDLKVGQIAFAIGNPFGLDHSMTSGIVSALGREIETENGRAITGAIQTSVAINPGNSGGPLLDSAGRLIGMNTAIVSPSGTFAGVGFAIPVDEINRIVPQLIRHGKVVRPRLGVQIAEDQLAQQLGVDKGALIVMTVPDGPAAEAGLKGTSKDKAGHIQLGDVIVAIEGKVIPKGSDLLTAVEQHQVGDSVKVTFIRDGKQQEVQVTLREIKG